MRILDTEVLERKYHSRTGEGVTEQERAEVDSALREDDIWEDDIWGQI